MDKISTTEDTILVIVDDSLTTRGKELGREQFKVEELASNMNRFLEQIGNMLKQTPERVGQFHFEEFEISAEVSADGSLAILGSGLHAGAKGGLKFVFRRSTLS